MRGYLGAQNGSRWVEVTRSASKEGFILAETNARHFGARLRMVTEDDGTEAVYVYLTRGDAMSGKAERLVGRYTLANYTALAPSI